MRKYYLLLPILSLSACATTGNNIPPQAQAIIQQVQAIAQITCDVVPAAETVVNIIALNIPALATAEAIGDAICKAILNTRKGPAKLRGVVLRSQSSHGH